MKKDPIEKELDYIFKKLIQPLDKVAVCEMAASRVLYKGKSIVELYSGIKAIEDIKKDRRKEIKEIQKYLRLEFFMLDCVILQAVHLHQTLDTFFRSRCKKPFKVKSYSYHSIYVVTNWLINIVNTLTAMKELMQLGYKFQFQVLFRTFIEQIDIIYAILLNEDFFTTYKNHSSTKDEATRKKIWYAHLRPAKIQEILLRELNYRPEYRHIEEAYRSLRAEFYEPLAATSHSSFGSNMTGAFFLEQKGSDNLISTLLGKHNLESNAALKSFILYANISLNMIPIFMIDRHKLSLNYFKENSDGEFQLYLMRMNQHFKRIMIENIEKEAKTNLSMKRG